MRAFFSVIFEVLHLNFQHLEQGESRVYTIVFTKGDI